ncbi:MauE/DoxX family redox-associated membrane protein [Amylibacter sp. IMCC11727]|uniref:MauE/DoxX family redox-associated membrane protein n=1 Tax=Amylibacter sp. IMCC11727 TaxID=3039851 RepID=UPI00244E28AB|nr:MauE/DoxX family redox-associated membrane protein [Amylibacter sp. IMCC11727]WGI21912.1 glutaredoxin domain-containing protein [Amylibacter sp. IMCC11727]
MPETSTEKSATLYRMVMTDHMCPFGLKSKDLLERQGYSVDDIHLTSREAVDEFKAMHSVKTTPQTFIDGERVGGFDDLSAYFGNEVKSEDATTYQPVIALFSTAALMAIAITWVSMGTAFSGRTIEWFISVSMVLLGLQKLQDVERFATMFLNYDLLAQRWVRYGYIYPFVETGAGILMMAGALTWLSAPAALVVASIGAVSVFKAVYIDKRELKCACVGGDSKVPLGFVSLTENLMMIGMAIWMLSKL